MLYSNTNLLFFSNFIYIDVLTIILYFTLVCLSVFGWAIIFDKIIKFKILKTRTASFDETFWSGIMLEDMYKNVKNSQTYPSALIFSSVMQEWESANVLALIESKNDIKIEAFKDRLYLIMESAFIKSMNKIKFGMPFLSIISSISTMIGLFIGIWGLTNSFNAVTVTQETNMLIMTPGIASGLLGILLGLFTAIPSITAYIYYGEKINSFENRMIDFCNNLLVIFSRELE
jgi:biopolymer transport protein TolQ